MGSRVTAKNTWPWCGTSTKPWRSVVRIEAKSGSHEASLHPPILAHTPMNGPKYAMERHERVDLPETANVRMPTHAWCTVFLARFRRLQYVRIRLLQCFHQPISLTADTCISFFFARVHLLHVPRVGNVLQCRACKMKLVGTHSCMGAHRLVSKSAKLWLTYVERKTCMVHAQTRRVRSVTCSMSRSRRMCSTLMTTISADRHYKC